MIERPPQLRSEHFQKYAVIYIRQSHPDQVRDHIGSTADQRALKEIPLAWGYPEEKVLVIEHDLGVTGQSSHARTGFKEMLGLIESGQVSTVFVREHARLSREPLDAEILLQKVIQSGTFVYAADRLFVPDGEHDLADLFAVRIQNLLAWYENRQRVRILRGAKIAKVRQGYAVTRPPVGYVQSAKGKWVLDPDVKVQDAVRRVFNLYLELDSLGKVVNYLRQHALLFPHRRRDGITWGPIRRSQLEATLRNPNYTDRYVFRRFKITAESEHSPRKMKNRPTDEWIVIERHHDPYVSVEQWEALEAARMARQPSVRPHIGKGPALLQGLICCPECGRWMKVHYSGQHERVRVPSYLCRPLDDADQVVHSIYCSGRLVDEAVVNHVLTGLEPVTIAAAADTLKDQAAEQRAGVKARARLVQDAEDKVDEARRQYLAVHPDHKLVKVDLGVRLEEAIRHRDEMVRAAQAADRAKPKAIGPDDISELLDLTRDIRGLWSASTTTNEDRKRLLRAVLSRVTVLSVTEEAIDLEIIWTGGLREQIRALRPAGVDVVVREWRKTGMSPAEIAERLRAKGITTAQGVPMSRGAMHQKLVRLGLNWKRDYLSAVRQVAELVNQGRSCKQIVSVMEKEAPPTLGRWSYDRVYRIIRNLRTGIPDAPSMPAILPIERTRQEIINLIQKRREEGQKYRVIADELNAMGIQPRKRGAFSGPQVRDLLREWKLRSTREARYSGARRLGCELVLERDRCRELLVAMRSPGLP